MTGPNDPRMNGALCAAVCIALAGGCASSPGSAASATFRVLPGVDVADAFTHADAALASLGYHVTVRDLDRGVIETAPHSAAGPTDPGRVRPVRNEPTRTIARVHLAPTDAGARVSCRVMVQERSTQAHRLFRADRARSDLPTETPIEIEGATTDAQNTVWHTRRRDRLQERSIIEEIQRNAGIPSTTEP